MANKSVSKKKGCVENYLISYNALQTLGWSHLLYLLVTFYLNSNSESLYDTVKWTLIIFQNAAVLEVLHAAMGMVRSNPIITAFQVASRLLVVNGVLMTTSASRETIGLPLALFAWSVTEIIRYSTYTSTLLDAMPYFLKWLRYTTFIVLYPIGVTGELLTIYAGQKEVGDGQLYSLTLPNNYNFIFNYQYFLWFTVLMYVPGFPQLYLHMFAQRKKVFGGLTKKGNNILKEK